MPKYHLANLSSEQMRQLERFEHDLELTLIAYAPGERKDATNDDGAESVMDALGDSYRKDHPDDL